MRLVPVRPPIFKPPGTLSPEQRRRAYDQERTQQHARDYDHAWRRLRIEYLARFPFCQCDEHQGKDVRALAEVVDHRMPIATHPHLRLEWDNLRSMTKACHDAHTARTRPWGER